MAAIGLPEIGIYVRLTFGLRSIAERTMTTAYYSTVRNTPGNVWTLVRDFNNYRPISTASPKA